MRHEAKEAFSNSLKKLLATNYKMPELTPETSLAKLDSLGVTEVCVLAEEELLVELGYDEVRKCQTFGELMQLVESRQ